jgi:transposase-like protein
MPRPANRPAREIWIARLKRYSQSNFTVAEFCRREGVSVPNFYQWKRKLAGARSGPSVEPTKFVPLQVTGLGVSATPSLRLPGGAIIELPSTLGRERLAELIAACIDATNSARDEVSQ